jgi:hypothetical protein
VNSIFVPRLRIVLFVQFVFRFQPIFQRVSTVNSAVASMDLVRAPLDFIQCVSVLVLGVGFGIAKGEIGLDNVGAYSFIWFVHSKPSFCAAQPISGYKTLDAVSCHAVARNARDRMRNNFHGKKETERKIMWCGNSTALAGMESEE